MDIFSLYSLQDSTQDEKIENFAIFILLIIITLIATAGRVEHVPCRENSKEMCAKLIK